MEKYKDEMVLIKIVSGIAIAAIPIVMCAVCYALSGGDTDDK